MKPPSLQELGLVVDLGEGLGEGGDGLGLVRQQGPVAAGQVQVLLAAHGELGGLVHQLGDPGLVVEELLKAGGQGGEVLGELAVGLGVLQHLAGGGLVGEDLQVALGVGDGVGHAVQVAGGLLVEVAGGLGGALTGEGLGKAQVVGESLGLGLELGQQAGGQGLVAQGLLGVAGEGEDLVRLLGLAGGLLQQGAALGGIGAGACQAGAQGALLQGLEAGVLGLAVEVLGVVGEPGGHRPLGGGDVVGGQLALALRLLQQGLGVVRVERGGLPGQGREVGGGLAVGLAVREGFFGQGGGRHGASSCAIFRWGGGAPRVPRPSLGAGKSKGRGPVRQIGRP